LDGQLHSRPGDPYLSAAAQKEYFQGCTYIQSIHQILTPDGALLEPKQFKATYGGYVFILDALGEKSTRNAWEAFTEAQTVDYPKVTGLTFRPNKPLGAITQIKERSYVNTFTPQYGEQVQGDCAPFLRHMGLLLPDPADRSILLDYMAACIQKPGMKFQWCPLIQGAQGNGKTILYHILEYALGEDYCHQVDPGDIDTKFNAWIERKLLVTVEEIRTSGRYEVADRLKPLITNKRVPVQGKGADQRTGDNCANFLLFSNHKDAVLKSKGDRRYAVFFTAQQTPEDMTAAGMTDAYFDSLFDWLNDGGYAHVAHYLASRTVSVNMQGRAPVTTSTPEAQVVSLGTIEQLIREGVELEEYGMKGGLISTRAVTEMLRANHKRVSPQRLVSILTDLGFIRHPALEGSEGKVKVDCISHRIYTIPGHPAAQLADPKTISSRFKQLQAATSGLEAATSGLEAVSAVPTDHGTAPGTDLNTGNR
jgi:hypothetical protein